MSAPDASGPPPDPREERYRPMGDFLAAEIVSVLLLCALALVLPGDYGAAAATGVLILLMAIPLVRVVWLVGRWFRRGDVRFALVGCAVLLAPLLGFLLSR